MVGDTGHECPRMSMTCRSITQYRWPRIDTPRQCQSIPRDWGKHGTHQAILRRGIQGASGAYSSHRLPILPGVVWGMRVDRSLVVAALTELADSEYQERVWSGRDPHAMYSLTECAEELFDNRGFAGMTRTGDPGRP